MIIIKGADQLRINQHLAWKPALFFNSKTQIFACRQHLGSDMDPLFFFFDSEVIFHVLFLLGTEEFTIYNIINNVCDLRTPLFFISETQYFTCSQHLGSDIEPSKDFLIQR